MKYPKSINDLINYFCALPSVGPKTAERYVFYLLKKDAEYLQTLAQLIAELKEKTLVCASCHAVAEKNPCYICSDTKRNKKLLAIVANTRDMLALESTEEFHGQYHVLGGVINTIEGVKPDQLNVKTLLEKIKKQGVKEIILALNPSIEGETTAIYLTKLLKPLNIKITRLARGLATGSDLEYADQLTLLNALKNRNEIK